MKFCDKTYSEEAYADGEDHYFYVWSRIQALAWRFYAWASWKSYSYLMNDEHKSVV